jgi:hypothetical protein
LAELEARLPERDKVLKKVEGRLQPREFHLREWGRRLHLHASPEANRAIHQTHSGGSIHGENATVIEPT